MSTNNRSREKIVRAATRLFQIKGYNATGLNEILTESQSPKGSLYYYFPNGKEQLALEAIHLTKQLTVERMTSALNHDTDPAQAIGYLISNIIHDLERENKLQNLSVSLIALETYASNERLRNACREVFAALSHVYAEKLNGAGFSDQKAAELGMVIEALIEGAITMSVTRKDTVPLAAVRRILAVLLMR